ncbi:hypothetical protein EGW08_010954 [Elysia chlorotica]|uniref:Uncharacterized protein n=1 Tax=Elysia chlorotica TaxID=188477 RepID=A0A3S0ZMM0_ELYCH|nr:hypothetical protein EGW08_010954 [Elysia chlorotica]
MPGTMNHNSLNATGIISGTHRDIPGSKASTGTRRPSSQQQQQQQQQHLHKQQLPQQLHRRQTAHEKVVHSHGPPKHSGHSPSKTVASKTQPHSASPSSSTATPSTLSPSPTASKPSASKPSVSPPVPSLSLQPAPPYSSSSSTSSLSSQPLPVPCPGSSGILSTTQLYPNNAALLAACGVPRPTSPQLSPNSKLASVFSSYPSLKPSPGAFCYPPAPSTSQMPSDVPSETVPDNELDLSSPSNLTETSQDFVSDSGTLPANPASRPSSISLSSSSMPSHCDSENNIATTTTTNTNNNNNINNNTKNNINDVNNINNNNNNNSISAVSAHVPPQGQTSRLSSDQPQVSLPSHQAMGDLGTLPGQSASQQVTPGTVRDDPSPSLPGGSSARSGCSKSELQVPREKAVVVPSSPPTPHRGHLVTQTAPPVAPTRLAQLRQNNLAIKKQMKTKTMKLPELSETSEHVTDETTPTDSAPPLQPLPPPKSRRSGVAALNSDRLPPTAKVMPQISVTDEDGEDVNMPASPPVVPGGGDADHSTPLTLPQSFLRKLGLSVEDDEKDVTIDQLSEKEVESKFVTLSLAFKTDKLTLDQRVIVQERARDIAEQNVDVELQGIRDAIETLGDLSCKPQVREVVDKIRLHIDILEISAATVSSRAEVFGAVQQERRLCKAMEVMVLYTENLRRIRAKEESEVQEARKVLSERSSSGYSLDVDSGISRRSMSVCGFSPGVRTMRRRSEVALPRILGGTGSPSPAQENDLFQAERLFASSNPLTNSQQGAEDEEGPKARFQSAVASTTMQHAVTATIRRASIDKQRSVSVFAGSPFAPNGAVLGKAAGEAGGPGGGTGVSGDASRVNPASLRKTSPQPTLGVTLEDDGDSCAASETSTSETPTPARKVSQDEQAYRKGFEQGLKAKLSDSLTELRDQQNSISRSLETVMDRVDQGQAEDAELMASSTRLESLISFLTKVREFLISYDWRSNKTAIRNIAGVAFLMLALLMMFLSPPVPAHTRASSMEPPSNLPEPPKD